jgi:hypothetical protein
MQVAHLYERPRRQSSRSEIDGDAAGYDLVWRTSKSPQRSDVVLAMTDEHEKQFRQEIGKTGVATHRSRVVDRTLDDG